MERRDFLKGALGATAATGLGTSRPALAAAPCPEEDTLAAEIRARLEAREGQVLAALQARLRGQGDGDDDDLDEALAVLARGAGAAATLGELDGIPVRSQVSSPIQGLLAEVAERVGAALLLIQDLLAPVAAGTAPAQPALLAALEEVEAITLAVLPAGQHPLGRGTLRRLRRQVEEGDLQGFAQRTLRRIRALQHIALRAQARGGQSRFLERDDPALQAEVRAAEADGRVGRVVLTVVGILGLVACGFLLFYGVIIFQLGVLALVACVCAGVFIIVAAMMIIVAGVVVGILSVAALLGVSLRGASRRREDRLRQGASAGAEEEGDVVVSAEAGWVPAGLVLRPQERYRVDARGQTHDPTADDAPLGPAGDPERPGGAGWRLPGAPEGALLGRVGGEAFLIGAARSLPSDPGSGRLELAINVEEAQAGRRVGALTVLVVALG